jgi:cell wall-associated NlpC family hydrolase
MTLQDRVLQVATASLGTPFLHQGRVVGRGLDCAGLYVHICKSVGLMHIDAKGYPRNPYDGQLEKQLDSQPCLERVTDAMPGDILAMRISKQPQHIGIHAGYIDGHAYIIHASEEHGKTCMHRIDDLWRARIMRVYRFVEVWQ